MSDIDPMGGTGAKAALTAIRNIPQAIYRVVTVMQSIFPLSTSSITHSATAGADTLPANPAGFLTVTINGVPVKMPFYNL